MDVLINTLNKNIVFDDYFSIEQTINLLDKGLPIKYCEYSNINKMIAKRHIEISNSLNNLLINPLINIILDFVTI
jgi:hypothetical protein